MSAPAKTQPVVLSQLPRTNTYVTAQEKPEKRYITCRADALLLKVARVQDCPFKTILDRNALRDRAFSIVSFSLFWLGYMFVWHSLCVGRSLLTVSHLGGVFSLHACRVSTVLWVDRLSSRTASLLVNTTFTLHNKYTMSQIKSMNI